MAGKFDIYGAAAERMYIEDGKTIEEIAAFFKGHISRKSIGQWCQQGQWVMKKKTRQTSASRIAAKIDQSIAAILDEQEHLDPGQADAVTKLAKTKHKYMQESGETTLDKAVDVLSGYLDFRTRTYPAKAADTRRDIDEYLSYLEQQL